MKKQGNKPPTGPVKILKPLTRQQQQSVFSQKTSKIKRKNFKISKIKIYQNHRKPRNTKNNLYTPGVKNSKNVRINTNNMYKQSRKLNNKSMLESKKQKNQTFSNNLMTEQSTMNSTTYNLKTSSALLRKKKKHKHKKEMYSAVHIPKIRKRFNRKGRNLKFKIHRRQSVDLNGINSAPLKMKIIRSKKHAYSHLVRGSMVPENEFKKFVKLTYKGLLYSIRCLRGPSEQFIKTKHVSLDDLQGGQKKKTLILDLDETLIHTLDSGEHDPDVTVYFKSQFNQEESASFNIRPYLKQFLEKMSKKYEIVIFTAAIQSYANAIINHIDPNNKFVSFVLTRKHCMQTKNGFFIKDLRIIKNRSLKDMLIVDNLLNSFGLQIDNGIPILEFINNQHDSELLHLGAYLEKVSQVKDIRDQLIKDLNLRSLIADNIVI